MRFSPQVLLERANCGKKKKANYPHGTSANKQVAAATCRVSFMVKLLRAYGGCLGARRRRRTWLAAISLGEPQAGFDPGISEWGNPCR
jgi:hypothetical protein